MNFSKNVAFIYRFLANVPCSNNLYINAYRYQRETKNKKCMTIRPRCIPYSAVAHRTCN